MEDLLSSIIVGIIAIISLVIKAMGSKPKKGSAKQTFSPEIWVEKEQSATPKEPQIEEYGNHPDSLESIFDEILGNQSTIRRAETPSAQACVEVEPATKPAKAEPLLKRRNATNRTFQRDQEKEAQVKTDTKKEPKKFNIREAVIYSEILTPKFKDEE